MCAAGRPIMSLRLRPLNKPIMPTIRFPDLLCHWRRHDHCNATGYIEARPQASGISLIAQGLLSVQIQPCCWPHGDLWVSNPEEGAIYRADTKISKSRLEPRIQKAAAGPTSSNSLAIVGPKIIDAKPKPIIAIPVANPRLSGNHLRALRLA